MGEDDETWGQLEPCRHWVCSGCYYRAKETADQAGTAAVDGDLALTAEANHDGDVEMTDASGLDNVAPSGACYLPAWDCTICAECRARVSGVHFKAQRGGIGPL